MWRLFLTGIAGAAIAVALLVMAGLIVIYSGAYSIAATEEHSSAVRWAFDTTFHNSIKRNADDIKAPETFTQPMIAAGAVEYKSMCQHCHAGPGVERASWANGMRPKPPHLAEAASHWKRSEIFWLVKHGAKMTGMPAFGPRHDDKTLWNIAAFVSRLPALTPEQYASVGDSGRSDGGDAHHDGAGQR